MAGNKERRKKKKKGGGGGASYTLLTTQAHIFLNERQKQGHTNHK